MDEKTINIHLSPLGAIKLGAALGFGLVAGGVVALGMFRLVGVAWDVIKLIWEMVQ